MAKGMTVRRVKDVDERRKYNTDFVMLKEEGDKFLGRALFEGDPSSTELGYFEYFRHYSPSVSFVPCPGDDCPWCDEGLQASLVADTLWVDDEDGKVKIFTLNANLIRSFTELREEGEKIKGRMFRLARTSKPKGEYSVIPKADVSKVAEVKEFLKADNVPDLEDRLNSILAAKLERSNVDKVLDDDDDEKPTKARQGRQKAKAEPEPEPEEEETTTDTSALSDETVTVVSVDKKNNNMEVDFNGDEITLWGTDDGVDCTDFAEGEIIVVSAEKDSDDDLVLSSAESSSAEPDGDGLTAADDLPDKIEGDTFVVVKGGSSDDETLVVENDDLNLKYVLYFLDAERYDGVDVDWEDYPEGAKINVEAIKGDDGDMVAVSIPEAVKAKSAGGRKGAKKTAGRK